LKSRRETRGVEQYNRHKRKKEKTQPLFLNSADAAFSEYQVKNEKSFQFAVFLVHDNYEFSKVFVFSREQLAEEILKSLGKMAIGLRITT